MKFVSLIFITTALVTTAHIEGCPTCIGTEHKENTPAFFSREFYQPGQSYAPTHTKKHASKPTAENADKEEADQAASMAAVLNDTF